MDEHRAQHPDGTSPDDEALARLRAADPAADARLDTAALRAEVARRTAADGSVPVGGDADPADGVVTELAPRRRTRWLQVAAVGVGAALLAGAGGYAVGATGGGDGAGAGAPIALPAPGGAAPMTGQGMSERGLSAAGDAAADLRIAPGFGMRAEFTAAGLADDSTTAHAWALDAAAVFSAETAARVAGVLGVPGEPRQEYGSWSVGAADGSGPSLSLQPDGTASISYYDPSRDPWSCTASATDTPDASGAQPDVAPVDPGVLEPALPTDPAGLPACDPAPGDAPTGDAAIGQVRDLLASLGLDPDAFAYEVLDSGDLTTMTTVSAALVVDGQQSGVTWSVTLVDDGVQSLYGSLATLVDLGEYPVIGAASAVDRLNDPRFGAGYGGVMPLAREGAVADDMMTTQEAPAPSDPTVPPTVAPGSALSWPVQQVTITQARLGLSLVTQADGAAVLVPAYELTADDGSTWSAIAVDERSLDLAG